MGQVITITLNPAFDVHYELESFEVGRENYSSHRIVSIGGKGLNISRALKVQGVDSLAVIVLGEESAAEFRAPLAAEGVRCLEFLCPGEIRYNITIHPAQGPETRLSLDNFRLDSSILEQIEQALLPQITPGTIIAFGSRVPRGLSVEKIKGFLARLKGRGAWLVLDSNSFSLQDLAELGPWLIKPNEYEIEALLGRGIRTEEAVLAAAREIHAQGVENVLISLGEQGLAYAGEDLCCRISVPKITPLSTIAAGDSVLAGYIYGYLQGWTKMEMLKTAAAFGTAACFTPGTLPPQRGVIARLKEEMEAICYPA
jgi:1-phosphofructokinase family hexose kinase